MHLVGPRAVTGKGVLQPGEFEQIAHQLLEAEQFPLQPLHQPGVLVVHLGRQAVAHQQQRRERGFELVGHITHPALLLLQLGFEGAAALEEHPDPAIGAGHHQHIEIFVAATPGQALGSILAAGYGNAADQVGIAAEVLKRSPDEHAAGIEVEDPLRFGRDVAHAAGAIKQDPPRRRGIHPAEQLAHTRHRLALAPALAELFPPRCPKQHQGDTHAKAKQKVAPREGHPCSPDGGGGKGGGTSQSGSQSPERSANAPGSRDSPPTSRATNGCGHPRSCCHRCNRCSTRARATCRGSRPGAGSA